MERKSREPPDSLALWNYADQREEWVSFPAHMLDHVASAFIPQTPRAARLYLAYRQRGHSPYNAVIAVKRDILNSG